MYTFILGVSVSAVALARWLVLAPQYPRTERVLACDRQRRQIRLEGYYGYHEVYE